MLALMLLTLAGCSAPPPEDTETGERDRRPWLVIGIDGGDWGAIERLWAEGRLPHLKALADAGTRAEFRTAYASSPVIWTTLATGRLPEVHGITGFTVSTDRGDVPVSSSVRKVPALWNMADLAGLDVAVLGWWASWPAEAIGGLVVSDRPLQEIERTFSPPELELRLEGWKKTASTEPSSFGGNSASSARDQLMSVAARELAPEGLDLSLVYYRSVDIECHNSWKFFEPEKFGLDPAALDPADLERIPAAYEAVDTAIGRILANQRSETNVLVISDHGFHAKKREDVQILVDMNRVLERLGYLVFDSEGKIDYGATRVYSYGTNKNRRAKRTRFSLEGREEAGGVAPDRRSAVRAELERDLSRLAYADGSPIFEVRDATPKAQREGSDFEIHVLGKGASRETWLDGQPVSGIVEQLTRISGTHSASTHGILIAAGPDIEPGARLDGISIFDFAPTLLYGLGLPVADDFTGRAFEELFNEAFRSSHPRRRVASWGTMESSPEAETSAVDQELLDELQALGYI